MTEATSPPSRLTAILRRKLHKRYTPLVFAFYMALIMAFLMCCIIVAANGGLGAGYGWRVLKAYALAMPVGFLCVILFRPLVVVLMRATVAAPVPVKKPQAVD